MILADLIAVAGLFVSEFRADQCRSPRRFQAPPRLHLIQNANASGKSAKDHARRVRRASGGGGDINNKWLREPAIGFQPSAMLFSDHACQWGSMTMTCWGRFCQVAASLSVNRVFIGRFTHLFIWNLIKMAIGNLKFTAYHIQHEGYASLVVNIPLHIPASTVVRFCEGGFKTASNQFCVLPIHFAFKIPNLHPKIWPASVPAILIKRKLCPVLTDFVG